MADPKPTAPLPPQNLDAEELAWAIGLFEGEGSITLRRNGTVTLSLAMTDLDIVERFLAAIGTGRLSSQPAGRNGRRKRLWRVDVDEIGEVVRILDLFYPRLGRRRQERADLARAVIQARIEEATFERECPDCRRSFRPPFTSNAKATRFCSRGCERRYHGRKRWRPNPGPDQEGMDV